MENMLEFEVSVFDADDVTGEGLTYSWVGGAASTPLAGCGGIGGIGRTCSTPVIQEFVTTFPVKVTVADAHGGSVTEEIVIEIWNDAVASDTTTAGVTMDYSITYFSKAAFTIDVEDGNTASCEGITLPASSGGELSGVYTPVAVIDYNPVTTYAANDVLAQSMDMVFDSSLGASSLWFTTNCNSATLTQLLADGATNSPDDSTKSVLSTVLSGPVLPAGQFLLIGAPLQPTGPPSASISGFSANAEYNGGISMNWGTTGTMLSNEMFSISISNDADSTVFEIDLASDQFMYTYSDTAHGVSYTIDIAICNYDGLCSTPVGTATVIGESVVFANNVSVQFSESEWSDNRPSWELSWDVVGDYSLVEYWGICVNLLQPLLSFSDGICHTHITQTPTITQSQYNLLVTDVYSEPTVELYFTIFAFNEEGDSSFMNAENEVNSIGSITYDKTEHRVGWPYDNTLDCNKELFADGTLTCMDGGTFLGGDLILDGTSLILGGEWNLLSDQSIINYYDGNLQLIDFSTSASGDQNLNITCQEADCSFKNSVLKQSYPYVFGSYSTVTIENSEFNFVSQNNANDIQPHFITYPQIRPIKYWEVRDATYIISPSEIITFISADSEEDGTTFSGNIVWGAYASEEIWDSNVCLRSSEGWNELPDLLSQYDSLDTGIEQMYLEIVDGNETIYSHRLQNFESPGTGDYDDKFLCSNLEGLENPVLLSYSANGIAVDLQRSLVVRYEANNSWGDYSQMIEFTEGSVEQPAPYMKLTTHSSDDVKYGTKSNFVTFLKIENPPQSTYEVNLICFAEIIEYVLFNNKTMTVLSNQTMLYQIEWMLEAPGQYDLSCKVDKHSHYPNLFGDNTDDVSEIAIVIIEEEESEGFLGGAAIALGAGGIGVFIAILLIVLFIRKQKANEEEDEEYVSDYYAKHNRPTQVETRTNISRVPPFSFEGSVDESGYEICEYPVGSGKWFWKDFDTQRWVEWE